MDEFGFLTHSRAVYWNHIYTGTDTDIESVTRSFIADMKSSAVVHVADNGKRLFVSVRSGDTLSLYAVPLSCKTYMEV